MREGFDLLVLGWEQQIFACIAYTTVAETLTSHLSHAFVRSMCTGFLEANTMFDICIYLMCNVFLCMYHMCVLIVLICREKVLKKIVSAKMEVCC